MRAFARLAAASLVLTLSGCDEATPVVGVWEEGTGYRSRPLDVRGAGSGFTALSAGRTGITHSNDVSDEHALANRNLLIGAGAAVGDVDGDGLPDLLLASVERPAALYRNLGGMRFEDITRRSGIVTDSLATTGVVMVDVDGDADLDVLAGTLGGPVKLWSNNGSGAFTDVTASSGLVGGFGATTMSLADVDGDGDLDLYIATYKVRNALDAFPPQARAFDQVVTRSATGYAVKPEWTREYRIEDRPDLGGIVRSQRAEPDLFFLNDGTGHFVREPIAGPRFLDAAGVPLATEPDFFTLAARFYDVNGDGAPDLYVCNDFEDPDQFWLNDGKGRFRLAPPHALAATSNTCMSVDFGDVDRDGGVDIFTADMLSPTLEERQRQIPTHTPLPKPVGLPVERPQWMQNMLHRSRGDGSWAQVAQFAGVAATDWTWGSAFLDVDLDGYEDLLTVSGHRWDIRDADSFDRIRNSFPRVAWNREQGEFPRLATRNIVLRNNGDLTFRAMPEGWGLGADQAISHALAFADFDLDGDLDVVITRLDAPAAIFRNEASAPRVAVRLVGDRGNRAGVGALITVKTQSLPAQSREMTSGGYYLSGAEAQLVFAAGGDSLLRIEVAWPGGRRSVVADARPNRIYEVHLAGASDASVRPKTSVGPSSAATLFENATERLGGHTHHEVSYDDFRRQPLLPNRLSQLGPGVAWVDIDEDGREDLVVGSGRGGALTVLRQAGTRFEVRTAPSPAAGDLTAIVALPDGRGGVRLVTGQSNYEAQSGEEALGMASVLSFPVARGGALAPVTLVAGDSASVGPLAVGDVNGDGRLDLFVAPRVVAGAWPLAAPSRLYLGSAEGRFVLDTSSTAALSRLGLVSAAVLADLDGDAAPELVVATEFGPLRVLHNEGGRFKETTTSLGLGSIRSRWNGVTVGDFDGDGRPDLVATSWGRNLPWGASAARPHLLVTGAFEGGGLGLVFARSDSASLREMPLESFARLALGFPALRRRVPTYAEFAKQSVSELFPTAGSAARLGATTYDHAIFLNRTDHFEMRSLPAAAQIAPASGVSVADFDGDGREDLFLAQNFFATEIGSMRFDGGIGLVLLGDGSGGFRALSVRESGVVIRGDQRGAAVADFDGDGRTDLAVAQNGGVTTLWRNASAKPGLRVRVDAGSQNPFGIGALVRVERNGSAGPARSLLGGGGYWSSDGSTTVLALPADAQSIWVRWPSGGEGRVQLEPGQREIRLRNPARPGTLAVPERR